MTNVENWPVWAVQVRLFPGPNRPPTDTGLSWRDVGSERITAAEIGQGRQYELNTVETGTAAFIVANQDEVWSPDNPSSPVNTGGQSLIPHRMLRCWASWPLAGNILNSTISRWVRSSDTSTFEGGTVGDWVPNSTTGVGPTPTLAVSTTHAQGGTKSLLVTWPTDATHVTAAYTDLPPTKGGQTYTISLYVWVPTGSPNVKIQTLTGEASAASSGNNAWVRISLTYTPAQPIRSFYVVPVTAATAGQQVWIDSVQLEYGASATAFTTTGPVIYGQHAGYITKYPERWSHNGYFGWSEMSSVDALSLLPTIKVQDTMTQELTLDGACGIWTMSDSNRPDLFGVLQSATKLVAGWGSNPAATLPNIRESGVGAPVDNLTFGQDAGPTIDGMTAATYTTGTNTDHRYLYADIFGAGVQVVDTGSGTSFEVWFKTSVHANQIIAVAIGSGTASWEILLNSSGFVVFRETQNAGSSYTYNVADHVDVADGNWHQAVITEQASGGTATMSGYVDGELRATGTRASGSSFAVTGMAAYTSWWPSGTAGTFKGSMAWLSVFDSALPADRVYAHYQAASGFIGETVTDRLYRLLAWSGLALNYVLDVSTILADALRNVGGAKIPDLIAPAVAAENGLFFADPYGSFQFYGRDRRYLALTPVWTLGEGAGEIPYQPDVSLGVDDQFLYNEIAVTSTNGVTRTGVNTASQTEHFRRNTEVSTAHLIRDEQQGLADHLVNKYGDAHSRVIAVSIDAATDAALWPIVLGAALGDQITLNRRTSAGVTISIQGFIERITRRVQVSDQGSAWIMDLQISPAEPVPWIIGDATYGVVGSTTRVVY